MLWGGGGFYKCNKKSCTCFLQTNYHEEKHLCCIHYTVGIQIYENSPQTVRQILHWRRKHFYSIHLTSCECKDALIVQI